MKAKDILNSIFQVRLHESPMLVDYVGVIDDETENVSWFNKLKVNQAKVNDHLYLSKLDDVSYIYEVDESMEMPIRLMLIYKIVDFPVLGQAITLVGAWRKVDSQYEPWQVFWNYIMPLDGCVVSDNIQTPTGREFFIKQCIDSFKRGGYAYVLDGDNLIELKPESIKCEVSRYYHGSSKGLSSRLVVWLPIN